MIEGRPRRIRSLVAVIGLLGLVAAACTASAAAPGDFTDRPSSSGAGPSGDPSTGPRPTTGALPSPLPTLEGFANLEHLVFIVQENR